MKDIVPGLVTVSMSKLKDPTSRGPESPCCVVAVVGVQLVTGGGRAAALPGEDTS